MYKLTLFLVLFLSFTPFFGQSIAGKFGLEITKAKLGTAAGPYRGRSPSTNGPFNQGIASFTQIYFPFQFVADYRKNFSDSSTIRNEYNNRIFLIRPNVLFHFVDNGSIAFGAGVQLSFLIIKECYLEYQISSVYLEATPKGLPDLNDGFNLHHYISFSKPISRHLSLSLGIIHLSGAGLSETNSNQDAIIAGIKWNL